jgi:cell division protein FtsB
MFAKLSLTSRLSLLLLGFLALFLGSVRYGQWKNEKAVEKEKQSLQLQISGLEQKNNELSKSLSYLGSSDFKERLAREQLNLKKDGEIVFGFTDVAATVSSDTDNSKIPNYEKWIQYFFSGN